MSSRRLADLYLTRAGEPSHFVLLRRVFRQWVFARESLLHEGTERSRSMIDEIIFNRADARALALGVLLEDLVDMALDNEWPIPPEIPAEFIIDLEEGQ